MNTPGIDGRYTRSNHIMEIEKILGIEAARRTIANEIKFIMDNHSLIVDARHIGILADIMTYKGKLAGHICEPNIDRIRDYSWYHSLRYLENEG